MNWVKAEEEGNYPPPEIHGKVSKAQADFINKLRPDEELLKRARAELISELTSVNEELKAYGRAVSVYYDPESGPELSDTSIKRLEEGDQFTGNSSSFGPFGFDRVVEAINKGTFDPR